VSFDVSAESFSSTLAATDDRRQHDRVSGPFDGRRVGILTTPLRIYDLCEGGCFVNSIHEQQPGIAFTVEIEVPFAGWLTFRAETIYRKPEFGFAVRFIGVSEETAAQLHDALERMRSGELSGH